MRTQRTTLSAGTRHRVGVLLVLGSALGMAEPATADSRRELGEKLLRDMAAEIAEQAIDRPTTTVDVAEPTFRGSHYPDRGTEELTHCATLQNSLIRYGLRYWVVLPDKDAETCYAPEGSTGLGMDKPSSANWYQNNFLDVQVDGKHVFRTERASIAQRDGAHGPEITFTWDMPDLRATFAATLGPQDDFLTLRYELIPAAAAKTVAIGFRCYPGHYAEPRARRAATRVREIGAGQNVEATPAEAAVVFFDELDAQHGRCNSCALSWENGGQERTKLEVGTYGVTARLRFVAEGKPIRGQVRLWDFADQGISRALERVLGEE